MSGKKKQSKSTNSTEYPKLRPVVRLESVEAYEQARKDGLIDRYGGVTKKGERKLLHK